VIWLLSRLQLLWLLYLTMLLLRPWKMNTFSWWMAYLVLIDI
jgi:hypothetical protein